MHQIFVSPLHRNYERKRFVILIGGKIKAGQDDWENQSPCPVSCFNKKFRLYECEKRICQIHWNYEVRVSDTFIYRIVMSVLGGVLKQADLFFQKLQVCLEFVYLAAKFIHKAVPFF